MSSSSARRTMINPTTDYYNDEVESQSDSSEKQEDSHESTNGDPSRSEKEAIAQQEGKIVFFLRVVVLLVLVGSAVAVSVGLYTYATGQEEETFEDRFRSDANKVHEAIGSTFDETLGATDAFITQYIAYAHYSESHWPFVTLPMFAIHATKLLKLSKAFYFSVYPFVEPYQKQDWEKYADENNDWIYESLEIQARDPDWHGANDEDFSNRYEIFPGAAHNASLPYEHMDNFLPTWQAHPMVPSAGSGDPYNYDVWDVNALATGILHADEFKQVVVSPQVNAIWNPSDPNSVAGAQGLARWAANYAEPDLDTSEPFSTIIFPIYDSLENVRLDTTQNNTFVGVLMVSLYWRVLIENILPDRSKGIIVVFEDSCGPPFTYRLDGREATFVGNGDLHEMAYDGMRISASLPDLASAEDSSYTGLPLTDSYCPRMIHIYPSKDMKEDSTSQDPLFFTISAALIFLFTSAIFLCYDFFVNRRQRIVMQRALASGAIVSSLFPEQVRKQMYEEKEQQEVMKKQASNFAYQNDRSGGTEPETSRPIANEFEHSTIMFGDLVGFTAWSSSRTPVEVFELLEAVYGRFDTIALRRKVFKVETIGDCYVAVTGLPNPQEKHAQIMVRFADDCLRALQEVTHDLVDSLGEDTTKLRMRIGLHSGSVTAGVLRGDKKRFQLFGDSVNTAARMESLGKPNSIHISEACADALRACGKSKWVHPREDKVVAKGLGEMTTYWVRLSNARMSTSSASNESVDSFEKDSSDGSGKRARREHGTGMAPVNHSRRNVETLVEV